MGRLPTATATAAVAAVVMVMMILFVSSSSFIISTRAFSSVCTKKTRLTTPTSFSSSWSSCLLTVVVDLDHHHHRQVARRSSFHAPSTTTSSSPFFRRPMSRCRLYTTTTPSMDHIPPKSNTKNNKNLWSVQECLDLYRRANNDNNKDDDDNVIQVHFLDATWFHKGNRDGRHEFMMGPRIVGSQYFDIYDIALNKETFPAENPLGLYTMFPPLQLLTSALDQLMTTKQKENEEDGDTQKKKRATNTFIFIYGRAGTLFTPRVWYIIRQYYRDHDDSNNITVGLMQGPLEEWMSLGGPVDTTSLLTMTEAENEHEQKDERNMVWAQDLVADYLEATTLSPEEYPMKKVAQDYLVNKQEVLEIVTSNPSQQRPLIVDTRGSSFAKGHIPGAIHIPYSSLTLEDNPLQFKPRHVLRAILKDKLGYDPDDDAATTNVRPVLLTCGSAVSVCHMALVLEEVGYPHEPMIYDGSWNEWGSDPFTPKVTVSSS